MSSTTSLMGQEVKKKDSVMEDSCELTAIVLHLIGSGARSYRYLKNGMMYKHPSVSYLE
ncbi:unnamed protein product [Callosobruchus maculatus]|nr:unnamed protein product [Callosobruchus maculatus]